MANSFWGGFAESLGPAIAQQQDSSLRRKMMEMQMQEYQQRQQAAQREQQGRQSAISAYRAAGEDPKARQAALIEAALSKGDFATVEKLGRSAGMSLDQTLATISKFQQGQGGQPGDPYSQRMDMGFSINPEGQATVKMDPYHPAGKLGEIGALLNSIGADPNDKNMQLKAFSVINAPPEAQSMLLSQLQQEAGGRGRQPQQGPTSPQVGMEIDMGNGQKMMVDNQETLAELQRSGIMPQGQAVPQGQQQYAGGGGGSPYDAIRQKEMNAAIQQAGGVERARTMNEGLNKEERTAVGTSQTLSNLVDDVGKAWNPKFTGMESIGGALREKTGLMSTKESNFRTLYNNLKRMDVRASAGLSQTATELENAISALGEPGLSDTVFHERLGTMKNLIAQAQEIDDQLLTAPRGQVPGILQQQRQGRQSYKPEGTPLKRRVGAGGAGGLTPKAQDYLERITGGQ